MAGLVELIFVLAIGLGWGLWELRSLRRAKTMPARSPVPGAPPAEVSPHAASGTAASPEPPGP